jgi:hypothetical protein
MGDVTVKKDKEYLGDSVYAEVKNGGIIITTENGQPFDPTNIIFLEPEVVNAFLRFVRSRT